jgi:enoyl-[acyl-carrier protein] reductase I
LKINQKIDGFLHSLAFANFSEGPKSFIETKREDYLQACQISSFSLVEMSHQLKEILNPEGSVVTISISNTKATSYGYLGPIKAMLDATVPFLAKSFSEFSKIRVNAVGAGPLKTSASAGIPNYIDNYFYAEELTLRKSSLETQEVANTVCFLLSPKSSGINASTLIVDAGMSSNYFDQNIVKAFNKK